MISNENTHYLALEKRLKHLDLITDCDYLQVSNESFIDLDNIKLTIKQNAKDILKLIKKLFRDMMDFLNKMIDYFKSVFTKKEVNKTEKKVKEGILKPTIDDVILLRQLAIYKKEGSPDNKIIDTILSADEQLGNLYKEVLLNEKALSENLKKIIGGDNIYMSCSELLNTDHLYSYLVENFRHSGSSYKSMFNPGGHQLEISFTRKTVDVDGFKITYNKLTSVKMNRESCDVPLELKTISKERLSELMKSNFRSEKDRDITEAREKMELISKKSSEVVEKYISNSDGLSDNVRNIITHHFTNHHFNMNKLIMFIVRQRIRNYSTVLNYCKYSME